MSQHFDAVVIGMGPGGEVVASDLLAAGRRVAVVGVQAKDSRLREVGA